MSGYKLSISMVPQALWGENLRKHLTHGSWNKLRVSQFEREPNCEFCGSSPTGAARHAHEEWDYATTPSTAYLVKLRTICQMCHFVEHPGFVSVMVAQGKFKPARLDDIKRHFCIVNSCKEADYRKHVEEARSKYEELARVTDWKIDFGRYSELVNDR